MQEEKLHNVITITDALLNKFNLDKANDLDLLLGVTKGSVASWRHRNKIPDRLHDIIIAKCNLRREWFKTGKGEIFSKQPDPIVLDPSISFSFLDPRLVKIMNLWDKLCQQQRDTLLSVAEGFAKQPSETSPENEEQESDYYKKKSA